MSYYDEDFKPWEIVDGRAVVADEAEWQKLIEWNAEAESHSQRWELHCVLCKRSGIRDFELEWSERSEGEEIPSRPMVKVPTDIFEDVEGMVVDGSGNHMFVDMSNGNIVPFKGVSQNPKARFSNILTRFLQTIDATQYVDYLMVTQNPELVREKWPCPSCKGMSTPRDGHGGCDGCQGDAVGSGRRPNIILAVPVETQSDIERLVPELFKCHDLCKGLAVVCNPKEELDFEDTPFGSRRRCSLSGLHWKDDDTYDSDFVKGRKRLSLMIAEGNEHPIHPDHVRSLRDQCENANVEFNFAGWGENIPFTQCRSKKLKEAYSDAAKTGDQSYFGYRVVQGPQGPMTGKTPGIRPEGYARIGKDKSGRLLDGQEHNGRVS